MKAAVCLSPAARNGSTVLLPTMTPTLINSQTSAQTTLTPTFRPDIEGLRAVAILLVVAFHARVPHLSGGYVGVDVFFVLSGYLITWLLVQEVERRGTVSLLRFYARRARRLIPALALVLIITMPVAALVYAPYEHSFLAHT